MLPTSHRLHNVALFPEAASEFLTLWKGTQGRPDPQVSEQSALPHLGFYFLHPRFIQSLRGVFLIP